MTAPVSKFITMGLPLVPLHEKVRRLLLVEALESVPQIQVMSPADSAVAFHVAGVIAVCPLQAVPPVKVPADCAT